MNTKPESDSNEEIAALLANLPERALWQRVLYGVAGSLALALGILGIILPGLPTTPFILLAGACFARSSTRLYRALLQNRFSGPLLRDWAQHRSITRKVRIIALSAMITMICISIWILRDKLWLVGILIAAGIIGCWVVIRIPLRDASIETTTKTTETD
ncbi:YbaN family protein [Orrella sp. 11846]|uniref:YbaN family protein n=1 Tax=Orrella sp. 11846 TaxID=3409913 RepID=UPI003B5A02D0